VVVIHADSVGSVAYNEVLSRRRAEAVATALAAMGVSGRRVTTVGYGKDFPIADNTTETNRALNRGADIYISDNEQPVRPRG
jgi:outer membrane protein OmpA-like peptidoglycan-associated protein